ncbi:hypothetical protein FOA52_014812 [Chlamydomonas sp. UWO 241]|nr:hypothetical protein FOA52_014812 [Chlamydomonas sp. UWO 241]
MDELCEEDMRAVFELFDKDKNGIISSGELKEALAKLGHGVSGAQLEELMAADGGASGSLDSLDYDQFLALLERKLCADDVAAQDTELRAAFSMFDCDRDGRVSANDLRAFMRALGEKVTEDQLKLMMAQADREGDGFVDFDKFARAMLS